MNRESTPITEIEAAQIIIVDDHDFIRAGLRSLLSGEPDVEVIGEAASGPEAISLCHRVHPDLVLMDVTMPEMDGLEATRLIKQDLPQVSVVIVTIHDNPDYLLEAIKAGAAGYIIKDATQRELVSAVRRVLSGESLLSSELATPLLRKLASQDKAPSKTPLSQLPEPPQRPLNSSLESLTPREVEVLRLLAQGHTNQQVARKLVVS